MNAQAKLLKAHPLLSLLSRAALNHLVSHSSISEFPKGSVIHREGDPCEGLYLLLSGRCESFRTLPNGHQKVINILVPGETFGDRDLLFQGHYHTTVRVITDSVLLRVDGERLKNLLMERINASRNDATEPGTLAWQRDVRETNSASHLGRVVTLASISRGIPDQVIMENLAQALHTQTGESVLLVEFVASDEKLALRDWSDRQFLGGGFVFAQHLQKTDSGYTRMRLQVGEDLSEPGRVAPLLSQLGRHFRYVLVHADAAEVPVPPLIEAMVQSDVTYLFVEQTTDNLYRYDLLVKQVQLRGREAHPDIRPVLYLAEAGRTHEFSDSIKRMNPVQSMVRGWMSPSETGELHYLDERASSFSSDIRRLAREIGRCRIGLVLSSGSARGLSHIGVIQVLEENGIEVDVVAGCSMGSYVAAVWAYGYDGQFMEQLARQVEGRFGLLRMLDFALPPRRGFVHGRTIEHRLKKSIGEAHFSDMVRPLRVVATNLDSLERVVFSSGPVARAVHASSAIPGVCVPVEIDGETYIDGGLADPLPVDVLSEMGVERIIAVNTIVPPEKMKQWRQREREEEEQNPPRWSLARMVNQQLNYFARGNILDVIMRGIHGAQARIAEESCRQADVVLRPLAYDSRSHEFSNPRKYIALGRKVAEEQLVQIKALVSEKASAHGTHVVQQKMASAA